MAKQKHPAISVAAKQDTFRRAGRVFGREPQTIALGALDPDAYCAITEDPSLVVVHTAALLDEAEAKALPHCEAEHVKRGIAQLGTLEACVSDGETKLQAGEADLQRRIAEYDTRITALNLRENELNDREAKLAEREKALHTASAKDASAKKAGK